MLTKNERKDWLHIKPVFVERLKELQRMHPVTITAYRDNHVCEVCNKPTGNFDFLFKGTKWNTNCLHNILKHKEVPERDFYDFVLTSTKRLHDLIPEEIKFMSDKPKPKPTWSINVSGSSNLAKAIYNVNTEKLMVEFQGGAQFVYSDVSVDEIIEFTLAESRGSWFYHNIRDTKECKRRN